jgi:hypothetical protein
MSDDFPDRGDNTPTTTSFEEWLDQQAASQGVSREELFEQLISSYWTLNEMMQLLDDSGGSDPGSEGTRSDRTGDDRLGSVPTVGRSGGNDPGGAPRGRDQSRSPRSTPPRETEQSPDDDADDDPLAEQVEELRERVDSLQKTLEQEIDRGQSLDEFADTMANRLTRVETELEELASDSESAYEELGSEYDSLAERLDALETDLTDRQESLADEQASLEADQERIRTWLDSEFDSLRTILEYLVSQSDDLDAQISQSAARFEEELSRFRAERDALQSLKSEAAEHGTHTGVCESCDSEIDLDLLERPYCPDCEASLTGVESEDRWLFFSKYLLTTDEDATTEAATRGSGFETAARARPETASQPPQPTQETQSPHASSPRMDHSNRSSGTVGERERARDRGSGHRAPTDDDASGETPFEFGEIGREPGTDAETAAHVPDRDPGTGRDPETSGAPESDQRSGTGGDSEPQTRVQIGTPTADEDDAVDPQRDSSAPSDSPFGDLDDLKRREEEAEDEHQ